LGRAFSLELAARGADVAIVDLDEASAESVAQEIGAEHARAFAADISDEEAVASTVLGVQSWRGDAAVLVNSAAMFVNLTPTPLTEISVGQWDAVLGVNLRGTFLCCRTVAPGMKRAGYGKIVNLSSSTFWLGRPGYPHYVSSKAGIVGLTRALASELGPDGIRVNAVAPGATVTEVPRETITEQGLQAVARETALRRVGTAQDIVGPVMFLAGPDSDWLTGQTLVADGGVSYA
jgi:3-oxoacyl-[acyl-carrier protein] reductase